ncbi:MAG: hypothetical protein NZ529_10635, partial [Cytophagaceae bacterium]|nr:hypothetical protein [Cytophagaceae bacterium]MDW8457243.1 hypothetical protein [Cytophagaceae bacterium]
PEIYNSVITGYAPLFTFDGASTDPKVSHNVVASTRIGTTPLNNLRFRVPISNSSSAYNNFLTNNDSVLITTNPLKEANWSLIGLSESLFFAEHADYPSNPNFTVTSGTASTGANFSSLPSFFTITTYRGAFGSVDWTDTWTEFRPKTAVY